MKIKLNSGVIVDERLNRAQRLIRLGKATIPKEVPFIEPSKKEVKIIKEYSEEVGWPISDLPQEERNEASSDFTKPIIKAMKSKKKKDKVAKSNSEYSNEL